MTLETQGLKRPTRRPVQVEDQNENSGSEGPKVFEAARNKTNTPTPLVVTCPRCAKGKGACGLVVKLTQKLGPGKKRGDVRTARNVMGDIRSQGHRPSTRTYTSYLSTIANAGRRQECERVLLEDMPLDGVVADEPCYNVVIQAHCAARDPDKAARIVKKMVEAGAEPSVDTFGPLLGAYGEAGQVAEAERSLREMESLGLWPKERTYNALIKGLCKANLHKEARGVLDRMFADSLNMERVSARGVAGAGSVRPSATTCGLLLNSLCETQQLGEARKLLSRMKWEAVRPTTAIFNMLIKGYALTGNLGGAENILREMEGSGEFDCEALGIKPDRITFTTLMNMWADNPQEGGVLRVRGLLEKMKKAEIPLDTVVYGTVMKSYLRAREPREVEALLGEMWGELHQSPSQVAWTTAVAAWVNAGTMDQAERVFEEMQSESLGGRVKPNHMTFHHLLWGYGKKGDLDNAKGLISRMQGVGRQANITTYRLLQEAYVDNGMPPPEDITETLAEMEEKESPTNKQRVKMRARGSDGRLLSTIRSEKGQSSPRSEASSATLDWEEDFETFLGSIDEDPFDDPRKRRARWNGRGNNRRTRAVLAGSSSQRKSPPSRMNAFWKPAVNQDVICRSLPRTVFLGRMRAFAVSPRQTARMVMKRTVHQCSFV